MEVKVERIPNYFGAPKERMQPMMSVTPKYAANEPYRKYMPAMAVLANERPPKSIIIPNTRNTAPKMADAMANNIDITSNAVHPRGLGLNISE